jgi:putative heme-binding domain-containing protein
MSNRTTTAARVTIAAMMISFATAFAIAAAARQQTPAAPSEQAKEEILAFQVKNETSGTAAAGRKTFEDRCAVCHRFGAIGKDVGPDLTTIASRFKRRDVLESILWPSKVISDQYQPEMFELNDGTVISGLIVRESATALLVRTPERPDKPTVVTKAQIANRAPSAVSMMPEGLVEKLSPSELADLLAFVLAPAPDK